jgi:hypothetical protein
VGSLITKRMKQRIIILLVEASIGWAYYKLTKHKGDSHVRRNKEVVQ